MAEKEKSKKEYAEQFNRVYDQLKYRESLLQHDFSNLYMSLSISMAFYGTILVFLSNNMNIDIFILYSFVFLLIPAFTYIFGLLFCYNLFAIAKGGYVTTVLENHLKKVQKILYGEADYIGWGIVETRKNHGRVLVYGTILMFYIFLPMLSIIWGIIIAVGSKLDALAVSFIVIALLSYIVYILFVSIIMVELKYFYKKFQDNHEYTV